MEELTAFFRNVFKFKTGKIVKINLIEKVSENIFRYLSIFSCLGVFSTRNFISFVCFGLVKLIVFRGLKDKEFLVLSNLQRNNLRLGLD